MSRAARDHQLNENTATVRIRNSYVKDSERARRGKERTNPTNLVRRSLARRRDVLHYRRRVVDVCARGGARRRAIIFAEKNALICTEREGELARDGAAAAAEGATTLARPTDGSARDRPKRINFHHRGGTMSSARGGGQSSGYFRCSTLAAATRGVPRLGGIMSQPGSGGWRGGTCPGLAK